MDKKKEVKYFGKISPEEIDKLKSQHGELFTISVPMNDDGTEIAVGYFKKPDRIIVGVSMATEKTNPLKAKEIILRNTFVAGNKDILDNDDLFLGAAIVCDDMIMIRMADIKKN